MDTWIAESHKAVVTSSPRDIELWTAMIGGIDLARQLLRDASKTVERPLTPAEVPAVLMGAAHGWLV